MKNKKLLFSLALFVFLFSCKKKKGDLDTIPSKMVIDVPSSASNTSGAKVFKLNDDTLSGEDVYENIRTFIGVGEASARVVENIVNSLREYEIDGELEVTFDSDEDGREKELVVIENASYEGESFELGLTMTDQGNEAITVYWSSDPEKLTAVIDPYEINHNEVNYGVKYRVAYTTVSSDYEETMEVSIDNFPINPTDNGSIDNLQLFVGKTGSEFEIYGNSNHPQLGALLAHSNAYDPGASYAFVAKANNSENIATIELGIAPSTLATNNTLLADYAVRDVLQDLLQYVYPFADSTALAAHISDAAAPGYFNANGFVSAGIAPNGNYTDLEDLSGLKPYVPNAVKTLSIAW